MILWCVFLLVITLVSSFNFAPEYAKVFTDPTGDNESFFGYTVALRKQNNSGSVTPGILIGAPRGNQASIKSTKLHRPGTVYWCSLDESGPCEESVIESRETNNLDGIKSNRSMSFLGGSLDVLDSENEFTVCSPQWKNEITSESSAMNGICYFKRDVATSEPDVRIYTITENEFQALEDGVPTPFYGYAEAGFSVVLKQDKSEILIGAPGVFNWRGAVLRLKPIDRTANIQGPNVPAYFPKRIMNDSYFGYSVGYGNFSEPNRTVYVAGAPRGADCKGKVYLFDIVKTENNTSEYEFFKEWEGTQLGEYFGSSLSIADFNGDGYDDVLVGAPLHSLKSDGMKNIVGDEGCVYMYISDKENGWKSTENQEMLMGSEKHRARFGTAISVLGDINMDGYLDVAIGAPYEDDSTGVVYIYLGGKNGVTLEYSQKLVAKEIDPTLRGFGFSISRGFDVDDNHYKDFAIGAHHSNKVVLVKSYPIVTIHPEIIPSVNKISFSDKEFNVSACVTYSGAHAPEKIDARIIIKADPMYKRANFLGGEMVYSYNTTLTFGSNSDCRNFTLFIDERKEFYKPIDIAVEYELPSQQKKREAATDISEDFCKNCPILNKTEIHLFKIPFGLGCKEDISCFIDLGIKAHFTDVKHPFVIGSKEFISFDVQLESYNDPAYLSKISVIFPRSSQLRRIPIDCQENGTAEFRKNMVQLLCEIYGPLKQGDKYNLSLELDMTKVPLDMKQLVINISAVISTDVDSNEKNNHVQLILPLQAELNVFLTGNSMPEQIGFASKKKDSDEVVIEDKEFTHTFLITNEGPSPVSSLVLNFKVPYGLYMGQQFVDLLNITKPETDGKRPRLSCQSHKESETSEEGVVRSVTNRYAAESKDVSSNRTLTLDCSQRHVRCWEMNCTTDQQFVQKMTSTVSISIKTKLKESESLLKNKDLIVVISSGSAKLTNEKILENTIQVTLWRTLPGEGVAWWIIFLAILGGFLILAAFIFCLYKFGFFKRDKQMQLQAMKHNSMIENEFLCENIDT